MRERSEGKKKRQELQLSLIFILLPLLWKIIISYSNTSDKLINCDMSYIYYSIYGCHYDQYAGTTASFYSFQKMN